jgi:DNA-binding CsgD family transcriptional regulator
MNRPAGYFEFLKKIKSFETPPFDWLQMSLDDSSLNRYIPLYGDHFKYAKSGAYLLDYSEQRYLHFDETASRNLTGYNSSYLLKGGLDAGLGLWDKSDLEVYDQQVLPANLDFLASVPIEEIPKYLFECTYKVRNKYGELKTVLQKSFFLHSTDKKLPTLVCGYLFDITPYKTDSSVTYRVHKNIGSGVYHQVKDDLFFPAFADRILSKRETEILQGFSYHYSIQQIANKLHISAHTVKNHLKNIRRKTGCEDSAELYLYARSKGLLG